VISYEIRQKIIGAHKRGLTPKELIKAYGYGQTAIYRLIAQERETGDVTPKIGKRGRKSKLAEGDLERIDKTIKEQPDITLVEIIEKLKLSIGESRLCRIVKHKLGYSYKKKDGSCQRKRTPRCPSQTAAMAATATNV